MDFIERTATFDLPKHLAWKKTLESDKETMGWKQEYFIFDLLPFSKKTEVIVYPREECFAPLKNKQGEFGPKWVGEALQKRDRLQFERVTGCQAPKGVFELSQEFYYPTKELLTRWRGKSAKRGYLY
jgi:UDP-N-acetylglucosamine/UDP-N-acetylgalactosamine diphosphorylase